MPLLTRHICVFLCVCTFVTVRISVMMKRTVCLCKPDLNFVSFLCVCLCASMCPGMFVVRIVGSVGSVSTNQKARMSSLCRDI